MLKVLPSYPISKKHFDIRAAKSPEIVYHAYILKLFSSIWKKTALISGVAKSPLPRGSVLNMVPDIAYDIDTEN
jgi:hypothetical protein